MELLSSNSLLMLQRSREFLWTKQTAILDNISNVETPGYKTKYVTFEESLREALRSAADDQRPAASMREKLAQARATVHEARESARLDENGVNITEQAVELARNGYQLQYVYNAISTDIAVLRSAIRGQ